MIWHNGETGGYHSIIAIVPARGIGVVVLANGNQSIDDIAMHLLDPARPLTPPRPLPPRGHPPGSRSRPVRGGLSS